MIIIAGSLFVDAADRDAYLADSAPIVEQARAAAGCLDFALSADLIEPDRINIHERWATEDDLERFRSTGPEPEQMARIRSAEVGKFYVAGAEAL